jgi:hypothetical protein
MPNTVALTAIAEMIAAAALELPITTAENIVKMQQSAEGSEILRLIVRDNLGGAAPIITNALWVAL